VKHPARWIALAVAVVALAFGAVLATQVSDDPQREDNESVLLNHPAPEFSVRTLDGTTITQADLAGKEVIVNFWNSWCIPCHEELPALKEFYDAHATDPDFVMLGIVRADSQDAIRAYVDAEGVDWVVAFDPGANATLGFATRGQPETFAINSDGTIVGFKAGPSSRNELETMLAAARVPS